MPPESATRVGHPAPFPVELPRRLIELFTYEGDVVLDPFLGSGTTAVAAIRTGRHYVGFDTDASYVATARRRITQERARSKRPEVATRVPARPVPAEEPEDPFARGLRDGRLAKRDGGGPPRGLRVRRHPDRCEGAGHGLEVQLLATDRDRGRVGLRGGRRA